MSTSSESVAQLRLKLQFYFIRELKVLKQSQCTLEQVHAILEQIAFLVNILNTSNAEIEREFIANNNLFSGIDALRNEFKNLNLYQICFKEILVNFNFVINVSEEGKVSLKQVKNQLIQIMSVTNFSDSFNVLYDLCTSLK